jgi:solute carrier family 13 (sodium-dependent dicarboxylate transporter), member 2/3/5
VNAGTESSGPKQDAPRGARRRSAALAAGAAAFVVAFVAPWPDVMPADARATAAVAMLMAIWWMTEALPLYATALVPVVLFPLLGVLTPTAATAPYANPIIFLFIGGFLIAAAMERWGLHRRVALGIVAVAGGGPRRLVLGFMVATAFLSMWISNTATAAMMIPIAIAVAAFVRGEHADSAEHTGAFGTALMLGVAYAATIGGMATLIGTPPNAVFAATARQQLGEAVSFFEWMRFGVPFVLVMLPLTWALLVFVLFRVGSLPPGAADVLGAERARLGRASSGERATAIIFLLVALGWLFREPKDFGAFTIPGINTFAPGIDDTVIAMAGALLLFLVPVNREGERVLDAGAVQRLPWGVILLFGGGLSLARAFDESGLTATVGQGVSQLATLPDWMLIGIVATTFNLLSELASNTAIAAMAMPLLAAVGEGAGHDPLVLMAAGALACSAAFMLPVGTPPNAIAFGTGRIRIGEMIRAGVLLNITAIVLVTLFAELLGAATLR